MVRNWTIIFLALLILNNKAHTQCADYVWTTWSDFTGYSATGTIITSNGPVTVSMTTDYSFSWYVGIYNYNMFANYPGSLPPNELSPCTTWYDGQNGVTTMCFSEAVTDPYLLIATLGNINTPVTLTFSTPYEVVFDGGAMNWVNDTTIIGTEGYGIIKFPGTFGCIQIHSITPEYCTNLAWGILDDDPIEVILTGDTSACVSTTITASGGVTYEWSGGQNPNDPTNQFTESGKYLVTVTDMDGCSNVKSVNISIHPEYESDIQVGICPGEGYTFNGQYLTLPGIYEAVFPTIYNCDSTVTLELSVFPEETNHLSVQICEGDAYQFQNDLLTQSGNYTSVLSDQYGCDSTIILDLQVIPPITESITQTICFGETYEFQGQFLNQEGIYSANLLSDLGCDSTLLLELIVLPKNDSYFEAEICAGFSFIFGGDSLTETGNYQTSLLSYSGCDSIIHLDLTVHPDIITALEIEMCEGNPYFFNGDTLFQSGIYLSELSSSVGCDSTVMLTLSVIPAIYAKDTTSICQGNTYLFQGDTLILPGSYSAFLLNEAGCDSILTLDLIVHPAPTNLLQAQICAGQSYPFQGMNLNTPGTYTADLQTVNGCDSTVQLTLEVVAVIAENAEAAVCEGESFSFNGLLLTSAGVYADTLLSSGGCDSIITLTLDVLPNPSQDLQAQICAGESYDFQGDLLTVAGDYSEVLTSWTGCDSTVHLQLTVHPAVFNPVNAQICSGQSYAFNGQTLTNPGSYIANLQTSQGCDSTVELTLTVATILTTDLDRSICAGELFDFGGDQLSTSGTYTDMLTSSGGCDSLVTLTLTVHPSQTEETFVSICEGEPLVFEGDTLTQSGQYSAMFQTVNGCDSTHILHLTVHPAYDQVDIVQACDVYTWPVNGQTYTQSTTFTSNGQTIHGCDSTLQLILTIHSSWKDVDSVTTNDPKYIWPVDKTIYTQSGTYFSNSTTAFGCDSVHILHLTLLRTGIYIPTAFSPNNDGINDRFTIYGGKDLALIESMTIYDRWGNKLATYSDLPPGNPECGWDGKSRDQPLDPGVYVFTGSLLMSDESHRFVKGEVNLVK